MVGQWPSARRDVVFMHASGISKGVTKACHAAHGHISPHITKASATDLFDPWRVLGHASSGAQLARAQDGKQVLEEDLQKMW